jgi:hypothetical protein
MPAIRPTRPAGARSAPPRSSDRSAAVASLTGRCTVEASNRRQADADAASNRDCSFSVPIDLSGAREQTGGQGVAQPDSALVHESIRTGEHRGTSDARVIARSSTDDRPRPLPDDAASVAGQVSELLSRVAADCPHFLPQLRRIGDEIVTGLDAMRSRAARGPAFAAVAIPETWRVLRTTQRALDARLRCPETALISEAFNVMTVTLTAAEQAALADRAAREVRQRPAARKHLNALFKVAYRAARALADDHALCLWSGRDCRERAGGRPTSTRPHSGVIANECHD